MKWIGQNIYDQVSRFRNEVYLEAISASTETDMLVVDSDGKITKRAIDAITVDVSDFMTNGINNRVLTATGADAINAEANLTFDGSTLSVEADSNTTANALFIDANSLTTGSAISVDVDDALTAANTKSLAKIHYDKSGVMPALNTSDITGLEIALNDDATNHALATSTLKGIDIKIDYDNATGAQRPVGVKIEVAKDGVVDAVNGKGTGWETVVNDGGLDFKCFSSANDHRLTGDFSSWATIANGATTITTHDHSGTAAHLEIAADGDITLDSAGQIKLEPVAGNNILLDGTIAVDAGVVTGATSITSTAFVGDLSTAAQPNVTTLAGLTSLGAAGATTDIAAGDLTMYNAVNNGAPTISIGSSANERLEITANYATGTQSVNNATFKTYTASSTSNRGRFVFSVDETTILQIWDAGLNLSSNKGIEINGTSIISDSSGTATLSNIDALDATTEATIEAAMDTLPNVTSLGTLTGLNVGGNVISGAHDGSDKFHVNRFSSSFPYGHIQAGSADENVKVGIKLDTRRDDGVAENALVIEGDTRAATFAGAVTVGGDLTVNSDTVTFESANADDPHVVIKNTHNSTDNGARLDFNKLRADDAVEQGMNLGEIWFTGQDNAQNAQDYAYIIGEIDVGTNGQESGALKMGVASHDGDLRNGLTATGGSVNDEVDVIIGNGAASLTTVVGTLTMGSTATLNNTGILQTAAQANITSLGTLTGLTTSGAIELGHATDTTLARSAAGVVTIEGNQIVTAGATTVASATQVPIGMQIARRTITQAEMNNLHNTPIAIIPALGANLVAIPVNGTIFVDRAANQTANAQLMIGYGSSAFLYSIYVFKRFHYNVSTDFHYGMDMYVGNFGTSMTAGVNTAINASANAAYTNNAFTSVDVYINYYVIDRS